MFQSSAASRALNIIELLETVFKSCLTEDRGEVDDSKEWTLKFNRGSEYPRPSEIDAPLSLAHVSKYWRSVALGTPKLWSQLHLEFSEPMCADVPRMEGQLSALQFWLSQSRSYQISVRLRLGWIWGRSTPWAYNMHLQKIPEESKILLARMVETLFKHAPRWENIEMLLPEFATNSLYDNIDQEYPRLISLKIENRSLPFEGPFVGREIFLYSAPNVKELALPGRGIAEDVFAPNAFPLSIHALELSYMTMTITQSMHGSRLRELALKDVFLPRDVLAIFPTAFPLLAKLVLVYDRDVGKDVNVEEEQNDIADWDTVVLDHLTSFRLLVHTDQQLLLPLSLITAPALEHLAVIEQTLWSNFDMEIIQFLRRSQAPVGYFCYSRRSSEGYDDGGYTSNDDEDYLGDNSILQMVEFMPALEELEVHEPALSSVMYFLRDPTHLPRLRKIYNEGELLVANISDGSPSPLSGPGVRDILTLINRRCRKRNTPNNGKRIWLEKLALPVHKEHEKLIRENVIFRKAVLDFESTHECQDGSYSGEFYEDYL